jgi:hypothetical protein
MSSRILVHTLVGHPQRFHLVAIDGVLILFWVGRPLHPHYKALASQFEPLDDVLPEGTIPFALSPSGLIPSPRFSELSPSPALVQHLRSIIPEYFPRTPHPTPDPELDSTSVKAATSNDNVSGQRQTGGFALPTIPMPAVPINMDVRNLKWGWPGYLTFGRNPKDKEKQKNAKTGVDQLKHEPDPETKPDSGGEVVVSLDAPIVGNDVPDPHPPKEEEKVGVEVEVDAVSLADAIESQNNHGGSSNECSPGAGTPNETPPSPATRTIETVSEDDATPTAAQPVNPVPVSEEEIEGVSQRPISTRSPSLSPEVLPPTISEPPPPPVTFSQTLVHLAPGKDPLRTTKRKLYYLTVCRSTYA